jgi:hypothetical protein
MEKEFVVAFFITFLFAIMKFIEMKFIGNENPPRPLKFLIRDFIEVFLSSLMGAFVLFKINHSLTDFINTLTNTPSLDCSINPVIFTDEPGF